MSKALIVYGTRYGAAASTSKEIAESLQNEGLEVKLVDAKNEKVRDITEYDLIIVGSGIQINRWTKAAERFLERFQKELAKKRVALFVCCGSASQVNADKSQDIGKIKARYLDEKAAEYQLNPIALGLFGGIYNFNKTPWWAKKALNAERPKIQAAYKESAAGVYDTRDRSAIQNWARMVAEQARS